MVLVSALSPVSALRRGRSLDPDTEIFLRTKILSVAGRKRDEYEKLALGDFNTEEGEKYFLNPGALVLYYSGPLREFNGETIKDVPRKKLEYLQGTEMMVGYAGTLPSMASCARTPKVLVHDKTGLEGTIFEEILQPGSIVLMERGRKPKLYFATTTPGAKVSHYFTLTGKSIGVENIPEFLLGGLPRN